MKKRIFVGALLSVFAAAVTAQQDPAKPANPGFIKLDKNKDNFLSRAEAEGDKDLHAIFTKVDLNKDGKLDEDEYLKGVSTYQREKAAQYAEDSAITTKVKAALLTAKGLPSTAISVETYKGRVQLSGFVDNKDQIAQAAKVVSAVSGVKLLQNNLATK